MLQNWGFAPNHPSLSVALFFFRYLPRGGGILEVHAFCKQLSHNPPTISENATGIRRIIDVELAEGIPEFWVRRHTSFGCHRFMTTEKEGKPCWEMVVEFLDVVKSVLSWPIFVCFGVYFSLLLNRVMRKKKTLFVSLCRYWAIASLGVSALK